jgi:hypothetical protein
MCRNPTSEHSDPTTDVPMDGGGGIGNSVSATVMLPSENPLQRQGDNASSRDSSEHSYVEELASAQGSDARIES